MAIIERDTYIEIDGTKLVNLSSHPMTVMCVNRPITIPPSGEIARCNQGSEIVGYIGKIHVTRQAYGDVKGLPEPEKNTMYIVSRLVAAALPNRKDLLIPGPVIRDENNNVIGCDGLSVL